MILISLPRTIFAITKPKILAAHSRSPNRSHVGFQVVAFQIVALSSQVDRLRPRGIYRRLFLADVMAGVTVGIIALPLAMAFGINSIPDAVVRAEGVSPPAMGLYTAVVAGFLISALGGSRVQIGGPTGRSSSSSAASQRAMATPAWPPPRSWPASLSF